MNIISDFVPSSSAVLFPKQYLNRVLLATGSFWRRQDVVMGLAEDADADEDEESL